MCVGLRARSGWGELAGCGAAALLDVVQGFGGEFQAVQVVGCLEEGPAGPEGQGGGGQEEEGDGDGNGGVAASLECA